MLHLSSILRTTRRAVLASAALLALTGASLRAEPARAAAPLAAAEEASPGSGWPTLLLAGIDLSAAQRARLDSIRIAYAPRVSFDEPGAASAATVSWAARLQMRVQQRNAIRSVLTTQQRAIFDQNAEHAREQLRARIAPEARPQSRLQRLLRMLRFGII